MWRKILVFILVCALLASQAMVQVVFAETQSGAITVGATVPNQTNNGGGGGGGGGGTTDTPPPEMDNPPVIAGVNATVDFTSARVTWSASDDKGISMSSFVYGTSAAYGMTGSITGAYQVSLSGLATDTLYFYKISVTDTANHTTESAGSFKTKSETDTTPPALTNVAVVPGETTATITWDTDEASDSQVQYGITAGYGSLATDASSVVKHKIVLVGLTANTIYHFRVIATDANGNSTNSGDGTFTTLKKVVPPPDVSNLKVIATDGKIVLSWENPTEMVAPDFEGVKIIRKTGSAPRSITDGLEVYSGKGQLFVDTGLATNVQYFYTLFSFDTSNNFSSGVSGSAELPALVGQEMCSNGIDDNADGLIDCADTVCSLASSCQVPTPTSTPTLPTPEEPTVVVPTSTVPSFLKITADALIFSAANRTVQLTLLSGAVTNITGFTFTTAINSAVLGQKPIGIAVVVDGTNEHFLSYNEGDKKYYTDFIFPNVGVHQAYVKIDYGAGQVDTVAFTLDSRPFGQVLGDKKAPVPGAKITLLSESGDAVALDRYAQVNPQTANEQGMFGWVVPNGRYYAKISAAGRYDYSVPLEVVTNNIFAPSVTLITIPPTLAEVIDLKKPLGENIKNVAQNLAAKSQAVTKVLQNLADNPQVQQAAGTVVAPAAAGIIAVSAAPLISWVDLLPLLRLLFLQPVLLLGRKKRQGWGQVYNSLSKLPVDLAIIRLVDFETGKVIQSRVTDKNGRYYFTVNPGKYRLEVSKEKMVFPSVLLRGFATDGKKADIYHGEPVVIKEKDPIITANIPLDPTGENKTPRRLIWEKMGKKIQVALSWFGLAVTAVSLYITPKWYVAALLAGHVVMFFVFRRLALPPKPKSWGIVYDAKSRTPVARAVARLFSSQFNKLVSTQITDSRGRYYFLAGDNRYYVTYDHKEYQPAKTNVIDLSGTEVATIGSNVGLVKKNNSENAASTPTEEKPR